MFDLNVAIINWRKALGAQPNFQKTDLEELEDHLREEIAELEQSGLSQEEAFLIASRRLGNPEDLNGEFAIADPERRRSFRLSWMITGALALVFLLLASEVLTNMGTGALLRFPGHPQSPFGLVGLGWFGGLMRMVLLILGAVFVWRLVATDRSAHKLKNISGGKVAFGALLLVLLAMATRMGSQHYFMMGTHEMVDFGTISLVLAYFKMFMLIIFPVLLLVGLWRLVKS